MERPRLPFVHRLGQGFLPLGGRLLPGHWHPAILLQFPQSPRPPRAPPPPTTAPGAPRGAIDRGQSPRQNRQAIEWCPAVDGAADWCGGLGALAHQPSISHKGERGSRRQPGTPLIYPRNPLLSQGLRGCTHQRYSSDFGASGGSSPQEHRPHRGLFHQSYPVLPGLAPAGRGVIRQTEQPPGARRRPEPLPPPLVWADSRFHAGGRRGQTPRGDDPHRGRP